MFEFCKSNNIKLPFVAVDDLRSIGVVERLIQTLKQDSKLSELTKTIPRLDVAAIIKTLRVTTPHGITQITPFEAHMGRKANTTLTN